MSAHWRIPAAYLLDANCRGPTLYIGHSHNTVTVYGQDVGDWNLQRNNDLAGPAGWPASSGVTRPDGPNYLNLTSPTGNLFFRLSR